MTSTISNLFFASIAGEADHYEPEERGISGRRDREDEEEWGRFQ